MHYRLRSPLRVILPGAYPCMAGMHLADALVIVVIVSIIKRLVCYSDIIC